MYKVGDKITIRNKQYEVVKTCTTNITCRVCNQHSKELPCAPCGIVCDPEWNQNKCNTELPEGCYPKPL